MKYVLSIILFLSTTNLLFAQSVVDELVDDSNEEYKTPELADETITRIAPSGKIMLLTNKNQSFRKGDFITLVLGEERAVRCLVAKSNKDDVAGIKILKIYSLDLFKKVRPGKGVRVLRGDDSFYRKKSVAEIDGQIKEEDDLFNETTLLQEDVSLEENTNRIIKTDNIISLGFGRIEGVDAEGASTRYTQLLGSWAYQMDDNIWVEGVYGRNQVDDYPTSSLDTTMENYTIRVKYIFAAPFYSYIKPYLGYQIVNADSPGAGDTDNSSTTAELNAEIEAVDNLNSNSLVFGVSWLKRLVPGWFVRADLGSDILSVGFALEF